ncbi:MAG: rhodanese-like domain-containing protein [Vulcanimicrobiaceae bacterium]
MSAARPLHLHELVASREDGRMLLLDVRLPGERAAYPIDNPFFQVIYAPRIELPQRAWAVAKLVGARHVLVVDTHESHAEVAAALLRDAEVEAKALEGGFAGWLLAVVEESVEMHAGVRVVAVRRVAADLHSYILVESGDAILVNPSGAVECFMAEFSRHHCWPVAVIDTAFRCDRRSCALDISSLTGAQYCMMPAGAKVSSALYDRVDRALAHVDRATWAALE